MSDETPHLTQAPDVRPVNPADERDAMLTIGLMLRIIGGSAPPETTAAEFRAMLVNFSDELLQQLPDAVQFFHAARARATSAEFQRQWRSGITVVTPDQFSQLVVDGFGRRKTHPRG